MKKMKKVLAALLALSMTVCMASCGETEPAAETESKAETEAVISPEEMYPANINPEDIHPGSINSDEDTSDRWYPNGDTSSALSFTLTQTSKKNDCVGLSFCLYKKNESGIENDFIDMPLRDGGNGHGITEEATLTVDKSKTYKFDLTFQDNFTCYDFETGTVWKRCHPDYGCKDQEWYDNAFSGLVAYRDISSAKHQQIVMNADHTFLESVTGMDDMTGHWAVKAANVLDLIYDNPEDSGMQVVDAGSLLAGDAENANETTYSDTWQQEFNISADGVVTEFGLYPKYDDDMNLIGYDSAFDVTTVEKMEADAKVEADAKAAEEAAAAQAKADALAAGSPYEQPEDKKDLSGVNLDQVPDYLIDGTQDYETFDKFRKNIGKSYGMIFELHGTAEFSSTFVHVIVQNESGRLEQKFTIEAVDVDDLQSIVTDGGPITVTGVLWNDRRIYTDSAHIKAE